MRAAIDTSVMVAATLIDHVHHERAVWWFGRREALTLCASWHAIAETWATLTRLPLDPPIAPAAARQVVTRLENRIKLFPPSPRIYRDAVRRCSDRGLRSGVIFDAIHLVTARHARAEIILTFNESDFARVREEGDPRIVVPPDPPGFPPDLPRTKPAE